MERRCWKYYSSTALLGSWKKLTRDECQLVCCTQGLEVSFLDIPLQHNMLVIMWPPCQEAWRHEVQKLQHAPFLIQGKMGYSAVWTCILVYMQVCFKTQVYTGEEMWRRDAARPGEGHMAVQIRILDHLQIPCCSSKVGMLMSLSTWSSNADTSFECRQWCSGSVRPGKHFHVMFGHA